MRLKQSQNAVSKKAHQKRARLFLKAQNGGCVFMHTLKSKVVKNPYFYRAKHSSRADKKSEKSALITCFLN